MKIAIYTPYLDSVGGGERYMLTIAESLLKRGHSVDLLLDTQLSSLNTKEIMNKISTRLNLHLDKLNLVSAPLGARSSFLLRNKFLVNYDVFFCLTDGSIFYSTAKKSILHIQSPIVNKSLKSIKNRIKLSSWNLIIYNSNFTKEQVDKYWGIKNQVVYPPVDIKLIKSLKKRKQILSVGRFFGFLREKKHEVMIGAFIELCKESKINGWSLNLVGSAQEGDMSYVKELEEMSKGYPINIYPNLEYQNLLKMYGQSSIYWHAMGFEEDDPTKMEHFGITTVEAMAGGAVPVVINKGGQREIVRNEDGFLWDSTNELKEKTLELINDQKLMNKFSKSAKERSKDFSKDNFEEVILKIVND